MTRIKLKYVNEYRDRHGRVRRYFRRKGQRSIVLPGLPGSIEFMAAYQAALAIAAPPPSSPKHVNAGSLAAVAAGYFRSADFANLSPSSQRSYSVALKPILAAHGHRLVRELPKEAARHLIEDIGARPRAAMTHLIANARGTPMQRLTKFIAAATKAAGLPPRCVAHGLRKAALRRLAEAGSTTKQIAAVSGHRSLSEIERYTARADQAGPAQSAIAKLPDDDSSY